jgi:VIT1/CCC1 family predicted Fe2+/Mn2+ transporter
MAKTPAERYLSPSERLSEVIFGIVMALTVTSSLRIALGTSSSARVTIATTTLGNNLAWGLVDAVMYLLVIVFERHRERQLVEKIKRAKNKSTALNAVRRDLKDTLVEVMPKTAREHVYEHIAEVLERSKPKKVKLTQKDILGALWSFALVFSVAIPIVIPYLIFPTRAEMIYASDIIATSLLFLVGYMWAHYTNWNKVLTGLIFVLIGVVISVVTVVLGGG